jgi:guanylate kinase
MIELIIGKSGSGKDTYAAKNNLRQVVSHTTRKPRQNEVDGISKHFHKTITYEFESAVAKTFFDGNYYWVGDSDFQGKDCFIVDINGIRNLVESYGEHFNQYFSITYIQKNSFIILKRLILRDGFKKAIKRFIHDVGLFSFYELREIRDVTGCQLKII